MPTDLSALEPTSDTAGTTSRRGLLTALGAGAGLWAAGVGAAPSPKERRKTTKAPAVGAAVTVTRERLDTLAEQFYPAFNHGDPVSPFSVARHGARHDVDLHSLTTQTRVPETGEVVDVTGLLAVPKGVNGPLPVVSWQHGTVLGFDQVPSKLTRLADPAYAMSDAHDSLETLFNIHRLAGQGFAVIGADYLGKGPLRQGRSEAYAVREATATTCLDILDTGLQALQGLGHSKSALFLNGWSQGGLNTQWVHQALRRRGDVITASAAQSPFNNLGEALRFWTGHWPIPTAGQYPDVPSWASLCLIIVLGSYRAYYQLPDLFSTAIKPRYQAFAEKYWQTYHLEAADIAQAPAAVGDLFVDGFLERFTAPTNSRFIAQVGRNAASFYTYDEPFRFYYGQADEALHPSMMEFALASAGPKSSAVAVPRASHRGTFLASLYGVGAETGGLGTVPDWFRSFL